ncbi:hypothetical protein LTR28_003153, partial [Elasticomyces elasticus]
SNARSALGAINSNAVPVAPARALSACTRRVVSMPSRGSSRQSSGESQYQTPREMNSPELDTAYPTGTARTIDLIAQFPSPSNPEAHTANDTGPPKHARRLSVFPPEYTATACNVAGHIDANSSTNRSPRESSDDSSNANIRGEATARYTSSGTPIYRPDTSSIRSFDRQNGAARDRAPSNLTPAGTPLVTALTELPRLSRQDSAGNNTARRRDSKFVDVLLPSDPTIGIGRASTTGAEIWPVSARPFARAARCSHVVRSSSVDNKRGLGGRAGDVGEACWRCRIGERFDRGMRRIARVCFCRRFEKEEDDEDDEDDEDGEDGEDGEEEEGGDVDMLEPVRRIEMAGAVSR